MLYLDTSALLKLYIREPGSEEVQARIAAQDQPLPVWEIQEMELTNALRLKAYWKDITADQAEAQLTLFHERRQRGLYVFPELRRGALMDTFRRLSAETPRLGCRTMDILHVACAVQLRADEFLTFDQRQRTLALHAGLSAPPLA